MSKHHLLAPLLKLQTYPSNIGTSRIDGIVLLCNYLNGDITAYTHIKCPRGLKASKGRHVHPALFAK